MNVLRIQAYSYCPGRTFAGWNKILYRLTALYHLCLQPTIPDVWHFMLSSCYLTITAGPYSKNASADLSSTVGTATSTHDNAIECHDEMMQSSQHTT